MPPKRPKPPNEQRTELLHEIVLMANVKFAASKNGALEYVLGFFTNVDLVGIRDDLKGKM